MLMIAGGWGGGKGLTCFICVTLCFSYLDHKVLMVFIVFTIGITVLSLLSSNLIGFVIHRVYSRDELLPLLEKCVAVLEASLDGAESKR